MCVDHRHQIGEAEVERTRGHGRRDRAAVVEELDVDVEAGFLEEAHVDAVKQLGGHFRRNRTDMDRYRCLGGRLGRGDTGSNEQHCGDDRRDS
jgi:hypothetical protein